MSEKKKLDYIIVDYNYIQREWKFHKNFLKLKIYLNNINNNFCYYYLDEKNKKNKKTKKDIRFEDAKNEIRNKI